ncbi:hypothetical protein CEXT_330461 [Caerostris extrusa]|uniref:Uncharacterized protein n=1 Tax=Caerostris extrusa TaxID=172846 RepID=A0AAV4XG56_CAEEX|nr:hypothetical protein CEXT_330461 [Caerostris extrusa]
MSMVNSDKSMVVPIKLEKQIELRRWFSLFAEALKITVTKVGHLSGSMSIANSDKDVVVPNKGVLGYNGLLGGYNGLLGGYNGVLGGFNNGLYYGFRK